ncbi:hypothetical protein Tco_0530935 [Tanacetum coccineum]
MRSMNTAGALVKPKYYLELEMTITSSKCRLRDVFLSNSKLVVTRPQVDSSCISDGASLYGDRATGPALGTKSIKNSTCRVSESPGKSSEKTYGKSLTIELVPIVFPLADSTTYLVSKVDGTMSLMRLKAVDKKLLSARF